jgi:GGDEF domain-containing protein
MSESKSSLDDRAADGRWPYLVVVAGFGIGRAFPIAECTRIGRDPDGEVVLPYWTVSWRHLTVSYRDGIVVAEDLGSRNGTFVGVDKIKRRELAEGDVLAIGDSIALKLVYAPATGTPGALGSRELPRAEVSGVANTASLLDRLRTERADERDHQEPIVLVFYRVDGLDEFGELSLVEEAMRQIAGDILHATKGETLLARAADGEFVGLSRTTVRKAREMAEESCRRISRQVEKRRSAVPPYVLTAAVVPLAPTAVSAAESLLRDARELAYLALADRSAGVITTAPLGASEGG